MIGPFSRIIARYLAGMLVSFGLLLPEDARVFGTDPDFILLVGGGLSFGVEVAYRVAKKRGWAT